MKKRIRVVKVKDAFLKKNAIVIVDVPIVKTTEEEIEMFHCTVDNSTPQCKSQEMTFFMGDLNDKVTTKLWNSWQIGIRNT